MDLKCAKSITYNPTNICPRCREEWKIDGIELTDKSILYPKNALRGDRTEEWVCVHHRRESVRRAKYKIHVSNDKDNYFWIVVYKGMFKRNPTEADLKCSKLVTYNPTNICPRCREEWERDGIELADKSILYPGNILRDTLKNGYVVDTDDPDSQHAKIKSLADRRIGNIHDPAHIFGDNCQECTCIWLGTEDLNKMNDNYTQPISQKEY